MARPDRDAILIDGANRARVIAEIQRPRVPWWRLGGALVAATAALVFAIPMPRPDLPPLHPVKAVIPTATLERTHFAVAAPPARPPQREPLTIKLQTSDPNIVIYWIAY